MIRAGDIVLVTVCAALVGLAYGAIWRHEAPAAYAEVRAPGEAPRRIDLDGERRIRVHGSRGDSILAVRNGAIRFLNSPCPGKQCVHSGWLDRTGEFAACLPNGVSLTMVGDGHAFDALNY